MEETNNSKANEQQPQGNQVLGLQQVPNSTAVLILGILSIIVCWLWGIVGLILGIIAIVLSSRGMEAYKKDPKLFSEGSLKNLRAGRICAIIGTSLSGIYVLILIIFLAILGATFGTIFTTIPWESILN